MAAKVRRAHIDAQGEKQLTQQVSAGATEDGVTASQAASPWQSFDHDNAPEDGMYWIAGTRPVLDGDVADNGMPFGAPTDEVERFVALVWLNTDEEDDGTYSFRFEAVDGWDTGSVTDYDHVTHFMECEAPAFPGEAAPAQEEQDGPLPDEQPSCRKCDGSVGFVCEDCAETGSRNEEEAVVG